MIRLPNQSTRPALEVLEDRTVPSTIAAQIPNSGVWRFEDGIGWQHLTAANASLVASASNGGVAVAIPGSGVWRWEDTTGWMRLTSNLPSSLAISSNGEVVGEFPFAGVWRFNDGFGWGVWRFQDGVGWQKLTAAKAALVGISSVTQAGETVGLFAGFQLWYFNSSGWRLLTGAQVTDIDFA
jgi:hypothetical protein